MSIAVKIRKALERAMVHNEAGQVVVDMTDDRSVSAFIEALAEQIFPEIPPEVDETAPMPGTRVEADVEERAREVFRQRVIEPRVYSNDRDENGRYVQTGLEKAWQAFRLGYVEGDAQHAAAPMLHYFRAQEQTRTAVAEFEAVSMKRQLLTINERLMEVRSQADPIQTLLMDLPEPQDENQFYRVIRQRMLALANYVASGRADP